MHALIKVRLPAHKKLAAATSEKEFTPGHGRHDHGRAA